ncbi:exonuclease domain-containing protein [Maribacter sp. 2307ULW6-5]|uniref:exonuclease domain-containing protein n=1 Tax=Maribacter sp. 2307ULW6-5 TaxID=3386275 RepID=UPI0039BC40C5
MYTILDIETTGGKYNEEGITEIAIHRFNGHEVVDRFISLINPEKPIQPFVVNLTGINNKMLRTAPKFHEVAKRIVEITEDSVLVAHNAQFDYRILRTEFRRLGYNFERKSLCTVDLSKRLLPDAESHSLGKLVRSLGIPVSDRHRANGDALATLQLFKLLLAKDTEKMIITETIRKEQHGELSEKQLDIVRSLPNATGVFYMHDKDGEIVYLSKTKDIKKRVNQLFTKSGAEARKLVKTTKKVTFERTGSELMAILKEHAELKKNRPRYNQISRKAMFSHTLEITKNQTGHYQIGAVPWNPKKPGRGRFKSMLGAKNHLHKIGVEHDLCDKLNGFSEAKKNCAKYADGGCHGACSGVEPAEKYNKRVLRALGEGSLYGKNVILVDKGREVGEKSVVVIKNGALLGTGYFTLNHQITHLSILEKFITPMEATENAHFIIEEFLRKSKHIKEIPLPQEN